MHFINLDIKVPLSSPNHLPYQIPTPPHSPPPMPRTSHKSVSNTSPTFKINTSSEDYQNLVSPSLPTSPPPLPPGVEKPPQVERSKKPERFKSTKTTHEPNDLYIAADDVPSVPGIDIELDPITCEPVYDAVYESANKNNGQLSLIVF